MIFKIIKNLFFMFINAERFFNVIVKDINLKPKNIKSIENKFLKEYIDIIV